MKKFLAIYLSLSLALMPTLAKAQAASNKDAVMSASTLAENISNLQGFFDYSDIKVISAKSHENVSLTQALKEEAFFINFGKVSDQKGYFGFKKIKMTDESISFAISESEDLSLEGNENVTAVEINTKLTANENLSRLVKSLSNLDLKTQSSKLDAEKARNKKLKIITIVSLLTITLGSMMFLQATADKPGVSAKTKVIVGVTGAVAYTIFMIPAMYTMIQMISNSDRHSDLLPL